MRKNKLEKKSIKIVSEFDAKGIDADEMKVTGVIGSDDSVDRHGDRINPKGWDLENYKKNPVIMLNHDYRQFPIGKAVNVKRKENALVFDIQFSKTLPLAKEAFGLVKEGIMKAWSVGFLVKEWATSGSEYTIDKMELLELSLVAIPANPNAILNSLDDNQQKMVKAFDQLLKSVELKQEADEKAENEPSGEGDTLEENEESGRGEGEAGGGEADAEVEPKDDPKDEENSAEVEEKVLAKLLQSKELQKLIADEVEKTIEKQLAIQVKQVESDEENASDPKLLLLTAIREELKATNKDTGKTLKSFNELLSTIKKE